MQSPLSNNTGRSLTMAVWVIAVVGVAGWLRFSDLDRMPFHADEAATGAQTLADRLEGEYEFDPKHHHGPMLTALGVPWARLHGESSWETLNAVTMRSLVAWCGLLTAVGVFFLARGWARLAAALLVGVSPLLVYYSRVFIHEPVFLLFGVMALLGWMALLRDRRPWMAAVFFGLGAGLMAATRETVILSLVAWGVAGICYLWRGRDGEGVGEFIAREGGRLWKPVVLAAGLCLVMIFLFYSSGGREPAGFIGFFKTYFEYDTGPGHEKPPGYYFGLLAMPKFGLGHWWCEGGILLLALGVWVNRSGDEEARAGRFFFEAGLVHLLIFSLIGYKTPWLVCLGWLHLCVAAGFGTVAYHEWLRTRSGWLRWAVTGVFVANVLWLSAQARWATSERFAADGRNPYAYVPTAKDVVGLGEWLEELRAASPESKAEPMAVVGEQYWPLPWYLREAGEVGYWDVLPEGSERFPVLFLMPAFFEEAGERLESTHMIIPKGLRDELPIVVAVRKDIWEGYQER